MRLASTIIQSPPAVMPTRLFLALAGALLLLRLPAVVQPMGADQGLYAYVGDRILAGELPYRDAWDQKPPAIHFTYAAMRAIWRGDAGVGSGGRPCRGCRRVAPLPVGRNDGIGGGRRGQRTRCSCCCPTRRSRGWGGSGSAPSAKPSSGLRWLAHSSCSLSVGAVGAPQQASSQASCSERRSSSSTTPASTWPLAWRRRGCGGGSRGGTCSACPPASPSRSSPCWRSSRAVARCATCTTRRSRTTSSIPAKRMRGLARRSGT